MSKIIILKIEKQKTTYLVPFCNESFNSTTSFTTSHWISALSLFSTTSSIGICTAINPSDNESLDFTINYFNFYIVVSIASFFFAVIHEANSRTIKQVIQNSCPENKVCFECGQRGPTYVDMTVGAFVCTKCSGML